MHRSSYNARHRQHRSSGDREIAPRHRRSSSSYSRTSHNYRSRGNNHPSHQSHHYPRENEGVSECRTAITPPHIKHSGAYQHIEELHPSRPLPIAPVYTPMRYANVCSPGYNHLDQRPPHPITPIAQPHIVQVGPNHYTPVQGYNNTHGYNHV